MTDNSMDKVIKLMKTINSQTGIMWGYTNTSKTCMDKPNKVYYSKYNETKEKVLSAITDLEQLVRNDTLD